MIQKSPFKFLDSFTKDDRDIFFGRDREIEELHSRVFESKILLVYGTSGTGKSSLINCGLANRFNDSDWMPVNIRRGTDINRSLFEALSKTAITKTPFEKIISSGATTYSLEKLLRSVWLDHFKPVFLIFDQFEELFIFGSREEKNELTRNISRVIDSDIQCRFIFAMREEYLAGVTEFERVIPSFLSNRIRIEKMTRQNAIQTIEGPCRFNNIEVEHGFSELLLEKLNPDTPDVELTWLQIYLDKLMRLAGSDDRTVERLSKDLFEKAGEVKDILGSFLEEQISQLDDPDTGMAVLKSFVSVKGTKHQISEDEVMEYSGTFGKKIDRDTIRNFIQRFIRLRILRDKDENGKYELRHDSLASKIFEDITLVEKELLEVKSFIENAYSNFEKRGLLLSDEDLKYIAPYEDKLFLNEKSQRFIEDSKKAIHRARRRKLNFAIAVVAVVIGLLSLFSVWAMNSRKNAIILRQMALEQKDAALKSKTEADTAKQVAMRLQKAAEESAGIAIAARNQSEADKKDALAARENALRQKALAERMTGLANEQADRAEEERKKAELQKINAEAAEKEARRLSMLSTAQNLALISLTLDRKPEMMGLLALQAYRFHINNGGYPDDPVIFKALDKAWSVLDNSKHSIIKGAESEIRTFAARQEGIIGADIDERLYTYDNQGTYKIVREMPGVTFNDFISLSPDGRFLFTVGNSGRLIIKEPGRNNSPDLLLSTPNSTVSASSWRADEKKLATGGADSVIYVWNVMEPSASPENKIKCRSAVRSLVFCGKDSLISATADGSVILWNLKNSSGEELFSSPEDQVLCLIYDKTRGNLLAGVSNGWIYLMDLGDIRRILVRSTAHYAGIDQLVFNKDYSMLASSSWDKVIHIYNYTDYFVTHDFVKGVKSIEDLDSRTRALVFSGDDKLVAAMSDKSIRVWETSSSRLASLICSIINRDMTIKEWSDYVGSEIPFEKTCGSNP
jgi:WD40 repeat protein